MSACDVAPVQTIGVRADNALQLWADQLAEVVFDILEDQAQDVRKFEEALRTIRNWRRRSTDPLQLPWVTAENLIWNTYLDILIGLVEQAEQHIRELEETAKEAAERLQRVLAEVGNPGALADVAAGLTAVAATASGLSDGTSLRDLAADDAWHGEAANAYRERSQDQRDLGFDPLAENATVIAQALEATVGSQSDFWESASALVIDAVIAIAGIAMTMAGLVATIVGIAAAPPSAGISLIVTVIGVVTSVIGLCLAAVGSWRLVNSWTALVEDTEIALAEQSGVIETARRDLDVAWPALAV